MDAFTPECVSDDNASNSHQGPNVSHRPDPCILEQIVRARLHQTTSALVQDSDERSTEQIWYALFERIFLLEDSNHESSAGPRDDLLFFVNKRLFVDANPLLQVHRKNSSKLPTLDDPSIDWEETIYLNLLMQFFVYVVTVAVCTRTGPQELQILNKFSETVYASPSRRRMDNKRDSGEFAYPDLFFHVDNYEEVFSNCVLRDCECLCVELTAYDLGGRLQGVCFLGAIQYGSLRKLYESKPRTSYFANNLGFLGRRFGSISNTQMCHPREPATTKFVQLLGPHARGLVEFAVISLDEFEECRGYLSDSHFSSTCCSCRGYFSSDPHNRGCPASDKVVGPLSGVSEPVSESPTFRRVQSFDKDTISAWAVSSSRQSKEFPPVIDCGHLTSLKPLPCSVKSAGASADTSPVRMHRYSCSRVLQPIDSSASVNERRRICGAHLGRPNSYRTSRVSKLLTRLTHCGMGSHAYLSSNSPHTIPVEAHPGAPACHASDNEDLERDPWTIPGEDSPLERHGRAQGSFAQSWSWFKERRRLTSTKLSTGLTFISLPCHSILSGLLETRREPILNIVY